MIVPLIFKRKINIFFFSLSQVEVDDDDEVMGDDGDDGFAPEIKLKSSNDVLDQVDKDTEEVLDFNFVSGSSANNATVLAAKDPNDTVVDGIKGDEAPNDTNGSQEWGKKIFVFFNDKQEKFIIIFFSGN